MSYPDAVRYCAWLSSQWNLEVRLPSEAEWEYAARGEIRGGRYPWGWGPPAGRACFNSTCAMPVGSFAANPSGLYDMAGNLFEWCWTGTDDLNGGDAIARGGSWAEKEPEMLHLFRRSRFRKNYRNADVGFRVVIVSEKGRETG